MSPSIDQSVRRWLSLPPFLVLPFCLVSIASFPGNVLASPSKLDHNCRSSIERSIQSSGFLVQPSGFISDRIQSSNSYDRALSEIWSSPPPAEISYADSRGNKRYYISIELPLPPGPNGQISPSIREKIRVLESTLLRKTNCIQTLRIGFHRSGPYQCTWLDPRTGSIRYISSLDPTSDQLSPRPGLDYCE